MQQLNYRHFTFRELLRQRKLAEKALWRNRNPEQVGQIICRIDKELEKRREIQFFNAAQIILDVNLKD